MGIIKTQQEFIGNSKRSGIPKGLQRISFCDYLRNFYSVKQIEIEPSSFNGYQKILENHIYPYFNERNIQFLAISSDEINTYLSYKLNNGFSSSTVKKHREVMGQALRSAFEKGWITDDIMSSVTNIVPDNSEKSIKSIPPDLLDSVLSFAEGTDIYVPVMLSVRYKLERAEILGLRWSDIDVEKREINIRNVVIKGSSSAYDIHPAADLAVRTLPAFDGDLAILEDEYAKQIELRKNNSKGKWFNYPVPLSVSGTDQFSGVRTGYIVVDGKTMDVNGNTSSLAYSGSQGMHEVTYQLEDFASNKSDVSGPYSFGFDTVLPVIKLDSNQSFDIIGPVVTINGSVTDNASGIKNVQIKYGANGNWENVSGQPSSGTLAGYWSQNIAQDVAEGYNNFFVRTTDVAGNISQVVTFTLRTDKTPPETVSLRVEGEKGPGDAYRGSVTFIGEAEDSVAGVKSIIVDLGLGDGEKPDSDSVAAGYSGIVTACVRAVDNVGNSTECIPQAPVTVDNEKPYPVDSTRLDPFVVYKGNDVFSVTGADALSGMYSASILLDDTPYTSMGNSVSIELGALGNGTHTISFLLTDNAGNVYDSADDPDVGIISFSVDSEPPAVVLSKPDDGEYVNQSVTAECMAEDNIGLSKIEYLIDGSGATEETLSGTSASFSKELDTSGLPDGTHTVCVVVTDKAGNESDPVQKSFVVDHTPPVCDIEVYGTRGDGGSFRGAVTLKAVCTDEGSGVDETFINTGDGRVPSETFIPDGFTGNVTPLVAGIDKAGNDSGDLEGDMILMPDGTPVSTILIDNTPPVVTGYYKPSGKWINVDSISMYVSGHDSEGSLYSGTIILNGKAYEIRTENDRADLTEEIPEGISSLKYYVTDLAGNRSEIIGN